MITPIWRSAIASHLLSSSEPIASTMVHLWRVNLCQPPEKLQMLWQSLAPDEQARASRFRFELHRNRAIASRGILRFILSHYLNQEPKLLKFNYTAKGKPFLANSDNWLQLEFNVSHSDDLGLYAITLQHSVGVDVEGYREMNQLISISQRYFSDQEQVEIDACSPDEQVQRFFQFWTAKEAVTKATGQGISEITSIKFAPRALNEPILITQTDVAGTFWHVRLLEPQTGYFAAVAHHPEVRSLCFFDWCFS